MDYSWVPSSWEEIQSRRNKEKSISFLKIFMQNLISSVVGAYWDAVNLNSIHIMMSFCVGEIWLLPLYLYWCPAVCRSEGSSKLRTFRNCESESSADPVWWGTHSYVSIPCIVLNIFLNNVQGKRSFSRIFVFTFFNKMSVTCSVCMWSLIQTGWRESGEEWMAAVASSRTILASSRPAESARGSFGAKSEVFLPGCCVRLSHNSKHTLLSPQLPSLSPLAIFPTNWHKVSNYFALNLQKLFPNFVCLRVNILTIFQK